MLEKAYGSSRGRRRLNVMSLSGLLFRSCVWPPDTCVEVNRFCHFPAVWLENILFFLHGGVGGLLLSSAALGPSKLLGGSAGGSGIATWGVFWTQHICTAGPVEGMKFRLDKLCDWSSGGGGGGGGGTIRAPR